MSTWVHPQKKTVYLLSLLGSCFLLGTPTAHIYSATHPAGRMGHLQAVWVTWRKTNKDNLS